MKSLESLKILINDTSTFCWYLDEVKFLKRGGKLINSDKIPLKCRTCGNECSHTLANIGHCLKNQPGFITCQSCKEIKISKNFLQRLSDHINSNSTFCWKIDFDSLNKDELYHKRKVKIPLTCKTCNSKVSHSYKNIHTAVCTSRTDHIVCQYCKLIESWNNKLEKKFSGEYKVDKRKSVEEGFYLIIHANCNKAFFSKFPKGIKSISCPHCFPKTETHIFTLKDAESLKSFLKSKINKENFEIFDFIKEERLVKVLCKDHNCLSILTYDQFNRNSKNGGCYGCKECQIEALTQGTFLDYNNRIEGLGLKVDLPVNPNSKMSTKNAILHYCTNCNYHPSFQASPYQVIFKKRRCKYCFPEISFRKDYEYLKNYVEMDQDRINTHCGTFKLLSTEEEINSQISSGITIRNIKFDVKQLQCEIHDAFTISYGHFVKGYGCTKCTRDRSVSYAHSYFQALCSWFKINYVSEYLINEGKTTYFIDFYLPEVDVFIEIDSIIHINDLRFNESNVFSKKDYRKRDRIKNSLLSGRNLIRIKTFDSDREVEFNIIKQLQIVDQEFISIYGAVYKRDLFIDDIISARKDNDFFKNSRIVNVLNKLRFYHDNTIVLKNQNHLDVLINQGNQQTFLCTEFGQTFDRNLRSVLALDFLCPICVINYKNGRLPNLKFSNRKIKEIDNKIRQMHNGRFYIDDFQNFNINTIYLQGVRFRFYDSLKNRYIFLPLHIILSSPERLNDTFNLDSYTRPGIKGKRYLKKEPVSIVYINEKERLELNSSSLINLNKYNATAKKINLRLRAKGGDLELEILENERHLNAFIHQSQYTAKIAIGLFEREIISFFRNSNFTLLTSKEKFANTKQLLLIESKLCKHRFYASWNWIKIKAKKNEDLSCLHKDCFNPYFYSKWKPGNKVSNEHILIQFKTLFNGQFYPVDDRSAILVREPIEIKHQFTGDIICVSFDNFRRGKFRHRYKNLTLEEIDQIIQLGQY